MSKVSVSIKAMGQNFAIIGQVIDVSSGAVLYSTDEYPRASATPENEATNWALQNGHELPVAKDWEIPAAGSNGWIRVNREAAKGVKWARKAI